MGKTLDKAVAVFEKLGADDDFIAALKKDDDASADTIDVSQVSSEIIDTQKTVILDDENNLKDVRLKWIAEVFEARGNKLLKAFPKFITKAEYMKFPVESRYDDAVALIQTRISENEPGKNDSELQKEVDKLNALVVEKDEEIEDLKTNQLPAAKNEVEARYRQLESEQYITTVFNGIKKDTVTKREAALTLVKGEFLAKYDVRKDDKGEWIVYNKGTNTKATHNSKAIVIEAEFDALAEASGLWSKQLSPPKGRKIQEGNNGVEDPEPRKFQTQGAKAAEKALQEKEALLNKP